MAYVPNDYYAQKARSESYLARSVYKLQEIDQKFSLLRKGMNVLDLGASPGSWSQFASETVGDKGIVVGIDLTPIPLVLPNARFFELDIYAPNLKDILASEGLPAVYDIVLSDMAPKTTGIRNTDQARSVALCEMALWVAQQYLKTGGHFVCKMFDNGESHAFKLQLKDQFEKVDILRPKSTRKESKEIFFIAKNFKGAPQP
jgi:23S rRNA (uridine2552-2'-O)-methyltransferase